MQSFDSFNTDQIVITKRQASMMMASMLLFCLFVFIVGFFLGKRAAIDDFSRNVTQDALHDQIDFLLSTQSLQSLQQEEIQTSDEPHVEFSSQSFDAPFDQAIISMQPEQLDIAHNASVSASDELRRGQRLDKKIIKAQESAPLVVMQSQPEIMPTAQISADDSKTSESNAQSREHDAQYAQLIGFGTKKAAQAFVARLKKHNVPVILKTIMSKSASGKQRVWYQAITPTYQSAQELQEQIAKIKRLEHIRDKDMKIVYTK